MMRDLAGRVAPVLREFASSTKYPTRTVEVAFAWILIVWSYSVVAHTGMISARVPGSVYGPMLALMPGAAWGWIGMAIGVLRLAALIGNGHWRPAPELRLIGAIWGAMFWIALVYCYWLAVDIGGGADFPMRRAFFVLIYFEVYSCYRCGIDIGLRQTKALGGKPSRSMGADDA